MLMFFTHGPVHRDPDGIDQSQPVSPYLYLKREITEEESEQQEAPESSPLHLEMLDSNSGPVLNSALGRQDERFAVKEVHGTLAGATRVTRALRDF